MKRDSNALRRRLAAYLRHPLVDLALFFVAALLALSLGVAAAQDASELRLTQAAAVAVVLLALNAVCGVYRRPSSTALWAAARTGLLLIAGVPLAAMLLNVVPTAELPQAQFGHLLLLTWVVLTPARPLARLRVQTGRRGWHVLFVDAKAAALLDERRLARRFNRQLIINLLRSDAGFSTAAGWRIVPRDASLADVVSQHKLSEIVVVPRQQRGGVLPLRQLLDCRLRGVPVVDLAAFIERRWGALPVEALKASKLIYGEGFRRGLLRRTIKRGFDVAVAVAMLAATSVPMAMAALALRLQGGAPIIERRLRAGRGGRGYDLFGFRADDAVADGDLDASGNDTQTQRQAGRTLQGLRLDWLPQLFNVLRGEMSIVGPRAVHVDEAAMLRERIAFYSLRFSVKPGLLSWAEVGRVPGSLPDLDEEFARDLYYVKHHSLMLDLRVVFEHARSFLYGGRSPSNACIEARAARRARVAPTPSFDGRSR